MSRFFPTCRLLQAAITAVAVALPVVAAADEPGELKVVQIESTKDKSLQPAQFYVPPETKKPMPLLVLLHTWSGDYTQRGFVEKALPECRRRQWALIHPNFRGPNTTPEACASELAVQDVLDAVNYAKAQADIDASRVYLIGMSGGGHMALMLAARSPQTWAGISAWGSVVDLVEWHAQTKESKRPYWEHLEAVCGGAPGESVAVDEEYRKRSPINFLLRARGVAIDLNAGIHDGHTGPVAVSQTLRAFNLLAEANVQRNQQFTAEEISYMTERRMIPGDLEGRSPDDPSRDHPVLVRREAGPVRVTIFNGSHETDIPAAIQWLAQQSK